MRHSVSFSLCIAVAAMLLWLVSETNSALAQGRRQSGQGRQMQQAGRRVDQGRRQGPPYGFQGGRGGGRGQAAGGWGGQGRGRAAWDPQFAGDRDTFHFLLTNRAEIQRKVKNTANGVQTVTTSQNPDVAKQIKVHVHAMHKRLQDGNGIHLRDPLFAAIFQQAAKVDMQIEDLENGVRVTETSQDPWVAKLIQAHAVVVTAFINNGPDEVHQNHVVPK